MNQHLLVFIIPQIIIILMAFKEALFELRLAYTPRQLQNRWL